jgi:hypothetical protein
MPSVTCAYTISDFFMILGGYIKPKDKTITARSSDENWALATAALCSKPDSTVSN